LTYGISDTKNEKRNIGSFDSYRVFPHFLLKLLLKSLLKKSTELNEVAIIKTKKAIEQKQIGPSLILQDKLVEYGFRLEGIKNYLD
jgi:hypothetical protein